MAPKGLFKDGAPNGFLSDDAQKGVYRDGAQKKFFKGWGPKEFLQGSRGVISRKSTLEPPIIDKPDPSAGYIQISTKNIPPEDFIGLLSERPWAPQKRKPLGGPEETLRQITKALEKHCFLLF